MLLRLEKIFFYLFIFCLPFQTRKIFYQWGDGFNEWSSLYFYLTDFLLISIFLFWAWRNRKERFFKKGITLQLAPLAQGLKRPGFWLIVFLIVSLISLVQAKNIQLGFYAWFKLLEMAGLFFYLKYNFVIPERSKTAGGSSGFYSGFSNSQSRSNKVVLDLRRLAQILVASGLLQALIGLMQYFNQKSLGLWYLRESPLGPKIAGVAKIVVDEIIFIRAYGTLPHPNLLAAFLFLSIFFFYFLWLKEKSFFIKDCLGLTIFGILLVTLWLTFSRLIIAVFILASLLFFVWTYLKKPRLRKRNAGLFILFIAFCSLFTFLLWPEISARFSVSLTGQAVGLRAFYNQTAFSIIAEHPWLGIGLGNFVWEIRKALHLLAGWLHQPVHNIYLLIASETGLIGLIVFLVFVFQLLKTSRQEYFFWFVIISFFFIGLFDHFFWTLQQGQLIFWLVLGLAASRHLPAI